MRFPPYFNSRDMPIRALAINGHEKLVGSCDGLFYIDEKRNRFKSFQLPEMRSGMIFCILFYEGVYYVGTYGGGMYIFNPERLTIRDFAPDGGTATFCKRTYLLYQAGCGRKFMDRNFLRRLLL